MSTKNKIKSYSSILEKEFGKIGTPERKENEKKALDFYASQIILHNRKECKITQRELAEKIGMEKSYISRIETGAIQPTFSTFLKIINALGKQVEII